MKKIYSYTNIVENYEWEYLKESFSQFLAHISVEIKNKLQDNTNVQFNIKLNKDNLFDITCENKKVLFDNNINLKMIKCVTIEYRYENKVCNKAFVTFGK